MKLMVGEHCMPCKELKAWLDENNIQVEKILASENMELATQLGVKSLPTLILDDNTLIKGGEAIKEYFSKEE